MVHLQKNLSSHLPKKVDWNASIKMNLFIFNYSKSVVILNHWIYLLSVSGPKLLTNATVLLNKKILSRLNHDVAITIVTSYAKLHWILKCTYINTSLLFCFSHRCDFHTFGICRQSTTTLKFRPKAFWGTRIERGWCTNWSRLHKSLAQRNKFWDEFYLKQVKRLKPFHSVFSQ